MKNTLVIITGPSCAGKSTLESLLVKKGFNRLLSSTTRPIRKGEVDGENYRFMEQALFRKHQVSGDFVEWVEFNGNKYGVLANDVFSALNGKNAVVVVEPHGKEQFEAFAKHHDIRLVRIFLTNPQDVILQRFLLRFGEDFIINQDKAVETYAARLAVMQTTEAAWHFDMSSKHYDLVFTEFSVLHVVPVLQAILRKVDPTREAYVPLPSDRVPVNIIGSVELAA